MGRKKKEEAAEEIIEVDDVLDDAEGGVKESEEGKVNEAFEEKLKALLKIAKKKKNILDPDEVSKQFEGINMGEEEYDKLL